MLVLLAACAAVPDSGSDAGLASDAVLVAEITAGADTPVRRVRWTTPEPSTGQVEFGTEGFDRVLVDDEVGTEHDVLVAGMPANSAWLLRAVSEANGTRWESAPVQIEAAYPPSALSLPTLTVPPGPEVQGFELVPIHSGAVYLTLLDREGQAVWWAGPAAVSAFRARFNPTNQTVSWIERGEGGAQSFVTSTLDRVETRLAAPRDAHADFVALAEGGFLVMALEDREIDGVVVRGETLQEVAADGTARVLWSSWEHWEWPGGGMEAGGGWEWPHGNSMAYDPIRRKVLLSLFYLDAVVQVDRDTGAQDWVLGGPHSDWTLMGEGFDSQHAPVMAQDGASLLLMNNGKLGDGPVAAKAMRFDLDEARRVATPDWSFDDGAAHTGVTLGNVTWLNEEEGVIVNWGSAGLLQRVTEAGDVRWELTFPMGSFGCFSEHVAELAGNPG